MTSRLAAQIWSAGILGDKIKASYTVECVGVAKLGGFIEEFCILCGVFVNQKCFKSCLGRRERGLKMKVVCYQAILSLSQTPLLGSGTKKSWI